MSIQPCRDTGSHLIYLGHFGQKGYAELYWYIVILAGTHDSPMGRMYLHIYDCLVMIITYRSPRLLPSLGSYFSRRDRLISLLTCFVCRRYRWEYYCPFTGKYVHRYIPDVFPSWCKGAPLRCREYLIRST